nr:hypothetical protein [Tanacetum cinerariifolium]
YQANEELSDGGSLRVIVYGYDGLPMLPVAPPSPDYIPGPEEPYTPPAPQDEDEHELIIIQPHDPDFMPEPIYPEYIPLEDEYILPAKEQPLPPIVSPTAKSPVYVDESDPEEDPKEYKENDTEDGPVGYPMDEGDDGDNDDIDLSGYDADKEDEDEEDEEEYLASTDSATVIPIDELASPPEGTESIIPPPFVDTAITGARITIRPQTSISLLTEAEMHGPTALPSPPLPPSLYPPPPVDRRDGYGIRDTWIDPAEAVPEMAPTTLKMVNTRVTELAELHEHDTQGLYALLEDAQDVSIRVQLLSSNKKEGICQLRFGQGHMGRSGRGHRYYSSVCVHRKGWGLSQTVHHELQTLREQVYAQEYQLQTHRAQLQLQSTLIQTQQQLHETHSQMQQTKMAGLRETNRVRQSQIVETLRVMRDMRREMGDMQAELLALRGQPRRAGQPGGDARVPNHQDAPRDADSHI